MHPNDVEPEMDLVLNPCVACGKRKVLKPGDYCRECAVVTDLPPEETYIVLSPGMLTMAAEASGIDRAFLKGKMERAFERFQYYVIYRAGGEWKDINISERFYIPMVMKYRIRKEE